MTKYTASHWGIYEVDDRSLKPFAGDADPCEIGLHQLDEDIMRLRVARPAVRKTWLEHGPAAATDRRGQDPFIEIDWPQALDLVAAEIARIRKAHGNSAIFGGSYGWSSAGRFHHAQSQVHRFLNACGGYVRHMDSYSLGAARVLMPHIVATMEELQAMHTSWDVMAAHTTMFVTFGGVPAKNAQISSGGAGRHLLRDGLRRMAQAGVRFVNVGPVRDNLDTGSATEWLPVRPNTDAALMLALAWVLHDENLLDRDFLARHCTGFEQFAPYLAGRTDGVPKTPSWAAAITGVAAHRIVALARDMAANRTMLNIAWSLQRAAAGEQPFWMLVTLAAMLGQIGLPGGGFGLGYGAMNSTGSSHAHFPGPTLPQGENAVKDFIPVARISDMLLNPGAPFTYNGGHHRYPDIHLVYWAGGNPFHHHQDLNRLLRAWRKPDTIVVHEQFWTATAKRADIVLPATTSMERNDIGFATREGHLVAMQQIIPKVAEARDDFAIFADLAMRLGVADRYTEGLDVWGWLRRLYDDSRERAARRDIALPPFEEFWQRGLLLLDAHDEPVVMLQDFRADPTAHPLKTPSGRIEIFSETIANFGLADCPGHPVWREPFEWLGAARPAAPLHMLSDQPIRRLHSQLDASPWSRTGKVADREPLYINPIDAAARGIAAGDVVEIFNARGSCLAGAVVTADVMPGVVRLATGSWYDPEPETGREKHGNPNVLTLDRGASTLSQGCIAQTCLVDVRGPVNDAPDVSAFALPTFVPSGSVSV